MNKDSIFKHIEEEDVNPLPMTRNKRKPYVSKAYINLGMFIKNIANLKIFTNQLKKVLIEEGYKGDKDQLDFNVKKLIYDKAYDNISKYDFTNKTQLKIAYKFDPIVLNMALDKALSFYEYIEDFDKCHYISSFKKVLGSEG